jgi:hypothetical protein
LKQEEIDDRRGKFGRRIFEEKAWTEGSENERQSQK